MPNTKHLQNHAQHKASSKPCTAQSIFKTMHSTKYLHNLVTSPIRHSSGTVPSDFPSPDIDGQPESNTSIFIKRKRGEKSSRKPIYQTRKRVRERKMPLCSRSMRNKSGTRLLWDSWVHYSVSEGHQEKFERGGMIKQRLGGTGKSENFEG
ncbi:hypothetical protein CDAR_432071 [Caerostris darwini]|uniref:Uncharacterized protein n=1 Tax=Caerostris darwini TaxID=1538125 RepID=A0AAV4U2Y4_9ARAC|nr:hypothetical protein CDAR_432071 [Caerostris darwini]